MRAVKELPRVNVCSFELSEAVWTQDGRDFRDLSDIESVFDIVNIFRFSAVVTNETPFTSRDLYYGVCHGCLLESAASSSSNQLAGLWS